MSRKGIIEYETLANERRANVSGYMKKTLSADKMAAINKKNKAAADALSKEAFKGKGFIPLPMASFGMPEAGTSVAPLLYFLISLQLSTFGGDN